MKYKKITKCVHHPFEQIPVQSFSQLRQFYPLRGTESLFLARGGPRTRTGLMTISGFLHRGIHKEIGSRLPLAVPERDLIRTSADIHATNPALLRLQSPARSDHSHEVICSKGRRRSLMQLAVLAQN